MLNGFGFSHLAVPHGAEDGVEFVELHLIQAYIVEEINGKGLELLGRFHQPVEDRVRVDLEDPRRPSNAESLGQAADDVHNELRRGPLTMENRARSLVEISLARHALKLTPGLAAGMAIGADITQTEPAAIRAIRRWTEMSSRIDGALAAPVEADRWRW